MLAIIIAVVAVILDQLTKFFVVQAATPVDHLLDGTGNWVQEFIPHVLRFSYAENEGGAWSMLDDGGWERAILIGVSLISMALLVYILVKYYKRHILMNLSLAMILGGGIGNMIDRFRLGYVVDFLDIREWLNFPIFNIADCFVTVGAILLGVYIIFIEPKIYKREQAEKAALAEASAGEGSPEPVSEDVAPVCEETAETAASETPEVDSENE